MGEQPKIEIPLDIPDVRVLSTKVLPNRELLIEVESTLTSTTCRRCGKTISNFYGYDRPIRLRHLPSFGFVVYLELQPKRFRCPFATTIPPPPRNSVGTTPNRSIQAPMNAHYWSS